MAEESSPASPSPPGNPTRSLVVGNDVVDLSHPRCRGIPLEGRFVDRVCTADERARILASAEPRRALWRTWAAKEAAYKVASKVLGSPPPFVHDRFRVHTEGGGDGAGAGGYVAFRDLRIPFREEPGAPPEALHVVAWLPAGSHRLEATVERLPGGPPPLERLGEREKAAVHSPASAWVRLHARARAADLMGLPESGLEIVCHPGPPGRSAPRLLVAGRPGGWDVSLSHHGGWIAWALGRP